MSDLDPAADGSSARLGGGDSRDRGAPAIVADEHAFDRLVKWTLVCGASAAPSFLWGRGTGADTLGMAFGVAFYIVGYTCITSHARIRGLALDSWERRTLRCVYGTGIAVSIVFPIGPFIDGFCGEVLSVYLFRTVFGYAYGSARNHGVRFGETFALTVLHGAVLNVLLLLYAIPIACLQRWPVSMDLDVPRRMRRHWTDPIAWLVGLGVVVGVAALFRH